MNILKIITLPDPLLRQASAPIERVDDELRRLMDDMAETMFAAPGIGLAAIQVAVPRRLIVVDADAGSGGGDDSENCDEPPGAMAQPATVPSADEDGAGPMPASPPPAEPRPRKPIFMINPEIVSLGDHTRSYEEGCLSLPDILVEIERPSSLTVRYLDRDGAEQELAADGLLATVIQHEIDHLNGKLIIDFLSRLKRDMIVRKFRKRDR